MLVIYHTGTAFVFKHTVGWHKVHSTVWTYPKCHTCPTGDGMQCVSGNNFFDDNLRIANGTASFVGLC